MSQQNHEMRTTPAMRPAAVPVHNQNQYSAAIRDCKPSSEIVDAGPERPAFSICVLSLERIAYMEFDHLAGTIANQRAIYDELRTPGHPWPKRLDHAQID
jgi:hypothetical protein